MIRIVYPVQRAAFFFLCSMALRLPVAAQVYEKVISFSQALEETPGRDNRGERPREIIEGPDRYLYGTTLEGGSGGHGTIYKMSTDGELRTLVDFTGGSGPVRGSSGTLRFTGYDGRLYGTSTDGGVHGKGCVFQLTAGGVFTPLVEFDDATAGKPGREPNFLLQAKNGDLFGTTTKGGTYGYGTVFRMTAAGSFRHIASFTGSDGTLPGSEPVMLVEGNGGNLFGIARNGGAYGNGVVFRLDRDRIDSGTPLGFSYAFKGDGENNQGDGAFPDQLYLSKTDGHIYGTTPSYYGNESVIFRVFQGGGWETVAQVYQLGVTVPRTNWFLPLRESRAGELFAALAYQEGGMICQVNRTGGLEPIRSIDLSDTDAGHDAMSAWLIAEDGNFLVSFGSLDEAFGALMWITLDGAVQLIHDFDGYTEDNDGDGPAHLFQASNGFVYGTTFLGGKGALLGGDGHMGGTVFRIGAGSDFDILVNFGLPSGPGMPRQPHAGVIEGSDGFLYGTSRYGGSLDLGSVFKMSPGGDLAFVKGFTGNLVLYGAEPGDFDGLHPRSELYEISDGRFLGFSSFDEVNWNLHQGTMFEISQDGETEIIDREVFTPSWEHQRTTGFSEGPGGSLYANGAFYIGSITTEDDSVIDKAVRDSEGELVREDSYGPLAVATVAGSAILYGVEATGGGRIFQVRPGFGAETFFSFDGSSVTQGRSPVAGLMLASDDFLYGTTTEGGAHGLGTLFRLSQTGQFEKLADFSGSVGDAKGRLPFATLTEGPDEFIYGTTSAGGASDKGTVFRFKPGGPFETVFDFGADPVDSRPMGRLILGSDGNFYGTTSGSENGGSGGVFRLVFDGLPAIYPLAGQPLGSGEHRIRTKINARGNFCWAKVDFWPEGQPQSSAESLPLGGLLTGYRTTESAVVLSGLSRGITYNYQIVVSFFDGGNVEEVRTDERQFVTAAVPELTLGEADPANDSARLFATVSAMNSETEEIHFEYSLDGEEFIRKPADISRVAGMNEPVETQLTGLMEGATYFYRIWAKNAVGESRSEKRTFTTLTKPVAITGGFFPESTIRVRVTGQVDARGTPATAEFEYRELGETGAGTKIPTTPGQITGSGPVEVSAFLPVQQGRDYEYRLLATSAGGSDDDNDWVRFSTTVLSGLVQAFPPPLPPGNAALTVHLNPPGTGAWRIRGETVWRGSGETAAYLVSGERTIEFLAVPGQSSPAPVPVNILAGQSRTVTRSYTPAPGGEAGYLTVLLTPAGLADPDISEADRLQWRFDSDPPGAWKNSGGEPLALAAGTYRIHCKALTDTGLVEPAAITIAVGGGRHLTQRLHYVAAENSLAAVDFLSFADHGLPYAHVGQIATRAGTSSGFAVKRRAVATAAHAVFDDGTMSYIPEVHWRHQRQAGSREPVSLVARGCYLLSGYAPRRRAEGTPGVSTPLSHERDCAVLYFQEDVAHGGYSGFLASEAQDGNEFLNSTAEKLLVGYPAQGIPAADLGKLHASPVIAVPLTPAYGETWTAAAPAGVPGCSGGPLFVRHANGSFYPAAVYLGGSGQSVFRAIDRELADLFTLADESGNGGGNGTGGGADYRSQLTDDEDASPLGTVTVDVDPAGAGTLAGWRLSDEYGHTRHGNSGDMLEDLPPGRYTLEMDPLDGYRSPQPLYLDITPGGIGTYTYTYEEVAGLGDWRMSHFGSTTNAGRGADSADPDGDGVVNLDEYTAGTDPNLGSDALRIISLEKRAGDFILSFDAKAGRIYTMERSTGLAKGSWQDIAQTGPLPADALLRTLVDPSPPLTQAFYRVRVVKP